MLEWQELDGEQGQGDFHSITFFISYECILKKFILTKSGQGLPRGSYVSMGNSPLFPHPVSSTP